MMKSQATTVLLLSVSLIINVFLSLELRASRTDVIRTSTLLGDVAVPLRGRALSGEPMSIHFDRQLPTVLYYFSRSCGWCERNWNNMEALVQAADGRYRVVGISADGLPPPHLADWSKPLMVLTDIDEQSSIAYEFTATPYTVLIGRDGRIEQTWLGAYSGTVERAIERRLGTPLPGLSPARPR